jgi:hypothetical protein
MNIQKFFIAGTEMNKMQFSEIESYLEDKGINVMEAFSMLADEKEMIYVSNGFVSGLKSDNEIGEWHHFFKKEGGHFIAGKFKF